MIEEIRVRKEPPERSDFDIDDIISELMTQSQKQKDVKEEESPEPAIGQQEEQTVVKPARVLMPKAKNEESEDEN